jgi:hypothetical protein
MDLPKGDICSQPAIRIRDLLRNFLALPADRKFVDGKLHTNPRRLNKAFVPTELHVSEATAANLIACLSDAGFLLPDKTVPTASGMALANAKRRTRISRARADALLQKVADFARRVNGRSAARVAIASIDVFGSHLSKDLAVTA